MAFVKIYYDYSILLTCVQLGKSSFVFYPNDKVPPTVCVAGLHF